MSRRRLGSVWAGNLGPGCAAPARAAPMHPQRWSPQSLFALGIILHCCLVLCGQTSSHLSICPAAGALRLAGWHSPEHIPCSRPQSRSAGLRSACTFNLAPPQKLPRRPPPSIPALPEGRVSAARWGCYGSPVPEAEAPLRGLWAISLLPPRAACSKLCRWLVGRFLNSF